MKIRKNKLSKKDLEGVKEFKELLQEINTFAKNVEKIQDNLNNLKSQKGEKTENENE